MGSRALLQGSMQSGSIRIVIVRRCAPYGLGQARQYSVAFGCHLMG